MLDDVAVGDDIAVGFVIDDARPGTLEFAYHALFLAGFRGEPALDLDFDHGGSDFF
jgi:hypothetical protein